MQSLDNQYWNERHLKGDTPWHIEEVSPAIKSYIDGITDKSLRILIPGAGHPHETAYLLNNGFTNVTVCDISEIAIENIKKEIPETSHVGLIAGDFFELQGEYDLIIEQTFFCALDPNLRERYVQKMYELLAPDGILAGLLFASHFPFAGPPFGGTKDEYKSLFGNFLHILSIDMCDLSIVPRKGNELFFICKKGPC